jgi:molybdopterin converting factor small subunit
MKAKIKVIGPLRNYTSHVSDDDLFEFCLESPVSLQFVVDNMLHLHSVEKVIMVNGVYVPINYLLKEGDLVQIFPLLAGG